MAVLAVSAVVAVLAWQGMVRRAETGRARSIHDRSVTPGTGASLYQGIL